jgi:beta-lactamase regulating signal transducer with metallopeptidase domain
VLAWVVIAMAGLLRVALGLRQLQQVRAGSEIIDPAGLDSVLRETLAGFRSSRSVKLAVSDKVMVPAAIGFFRPMIVLPAWALRELSTAELNAILIHELAHLQRRDDWTNLAQKVLRAVLFFHPAVWWLERQLSLEREMACDDIVLARTANPRAYAECLVNVAERSFTRRGLALAQAAVSKVRQTTLRVSQILDVKRSAATQVWRPALGLVAVALGIFVVGLARAPELVAFRESAPVMTSSVAAPASLTKDFPEPAVARATPVSFTLKPLAQSRSAAAKPVHAKASTSQPGTEILAKAMLPVSLQRSAPEQTVLVVMHGEQFGSSGASWMVYVWRFTLLRPEQVPIGLRIPAKSI